MVKKKSTIKVYLPPKKPKKKPKRKKPIIRNKNFGMLQKEIIDNIRVNTVQKKLEEALKNKDYAEFDRLKSAQTGQDARMGINLVLNALNLLKQKVDDILITAQSYDPTNPVVVNIEAEGGLLKKTLDKLFNELIMLRPKIGKFTDKDKDRLRQIKNEVDRISSSVNKIHGLLDKVKTMRKMTPEEKKIALGKKKIRDIQKDIKSDIKDLYTFGFDTTKDEQEKLKKLLEDKETGRYAGEVISEELKKRASDGFDKLEELKEKFKIIENINNVLVESAPDISRMAGFPIKNIRNYTDTVKQIKKKLNKLDKSISKASLKNMDDVKDYISLTQNQIIDLEKDISDAISLGKHYIDETEDKTKVGKIPSEGLETINKYIEDYKKIIAKFRDVYYLDIVHLFDKTIKQPESGANRTKLDTDYGRELVLNLKDAFGDKYNLKSDGTKLFETNQYARQAYEAYMNYYKDVLKKAEDELKTLIKIKDYYKSSAKNKEYKKMHEFYNEAVVLYDSNYAIIKDFIDRMKYVYKIFTNFTAAEVREARKKKKEDEKEEKRKKKEEEKRKKKEEKEKKEKEKTDEDKKKELLETKGITEINHYINAVKNILQNVKELKKKYIEHIKTYSTKGAPKKMKTKTSTSNVYDKLTNLTDYNKSPYFYGVTLYDKNDLEDATIRGIFTIYKDDIKEVITGFENKDGKKYKGIQETLNEMNEYKDDYNKLIEEGKYEEAFKLIKTIQDLEIGVKNNIDVSYGEYKNILDIFEKGET